MSEVKRLYRSRTDRVIGGVCAGLAKYTNMDPALMRVIWVLGSIFVAGIGGVIAYVILMAVVPEEPLETPLPPPPPPTT